MRTAVVCSAVAAVLASGSGALSGTNETRAGREIVVSATRVETMAERLASAVTVIGASEIAAKNPDGLASALERAPGLTITRYGGPGSQSAVFLRGASSEQTLILIDGVEVNDPSAPGRAGALDYLDTASIERIEVLRGPQSGLYGSDAMAGVINIVTKQGAGRPALTLQAEGGSYHTFRESAALRGSEGIFHYSLSAQRTDSDGISAAREQDGNSERDGYDSTTLSGRFGVAPSARFDAELFARWLRAKYDFDAAGGPGGDSPTDHGEEERLYLRPQAHLSLSDGDWQQYLGGSLAVHDRTSDGMFGHSTYDGQLRKADWRHDLRLGDRHLLTAGAELEHETAESEQTAEVSADTASAYAQDHFTASEILSAVGSVRFDEHDAFGSQWTYRIAPLAVLPATATRLKATYGTAFKAPSLYQLYAPATSYGPVGNADLDAETSRGWDAGVEQPLGDRLTVGATWFENRFEDLIDFDNGFVNRSEARTRGLECTATCRPNDAVRMVGAYTYTETEDLDTGDELIRRPKHRASLDAFYRWNPKVETGVGILHVGERADRYYSATMFTAEDVTLDAYTVVNLYGSWRVRKNLELYGRVENLLDEDYEEIAGYGTPGLSGYAGAKLTL